MHGCRVHQLELSLGRKICDCLERLDTDGLGVGSAPREGRVVTSRGDERVDRS